MNVWSEHPAARELQRLWRPLLCVALAIAWLAARNRPSISAAVLSYASLVALAAVLLYWSAAHSTARRSAVLTVGWLGMGLLLFVYIWTERYAHRWTDAAGTMFDDRVRRWGGAVEYRRITRLADEGLGWNEGPMRDGKQHGRWQRHETRPPQVNFLWYWEGQTVSQQEWERRKEATQ